MKKILLNIIIIIIFFYKWCVPQLSAPLHSLPLPRRQLWVSGSVWRTGLRPHHTLQQSEPGLWWPWQHLCCVVGEPLLCRFWAVLQRDNWIIVPLKHGTVQARPILCFLAEAVWVSCHICWFLVDSMVPCILTTYPGPLEEKQPTTSQIHCELLSDQIIYNQLSE